MRAEVATSQRHLTGLPLHMADVDLLTKYVFPFVDASWSVPFTVVDAVTLGPRLFRGTFEMRGRSLHSDARAARLEPITTLPLARFQEVVHFDPWWAFRGVAGIDRAWVDAVLATNLAGSFHEKGTDYKMHDFVFNESLTKLEAVVAKDPVFRTVTFHSGELDLLPLRRPPRK